MQGSIDHIPIAASLLDYLYHHMFYKLGLIT